MPRPKTTSSLAILSTTDSYPQEKLLLNIGEVAHLTGLSVSTLYHFVSQKRIPVVRISSRCIRFDTRAILEWIAELSLPAGYDGQWPKSYCKGPQVSFQKNDQENSSTDRSNSQLDTFRFR